ncbi:hypothetical protein [Paenibacillus senegalensis]|uniref:hypothetical protein n=1 Tax=Paenibacillus senegalensis TaxID=1465766 RepID=UPI0002882FC6|nr:hypothetical protein [Paenibacillus senegalensis]
MNGNPFYQVERLIAFVQANQWQVSALAMIGLGIFAMTFFSIRNRRLRIMKSVFERTSLYVKVERGKRVSRLYPSLIRYSDTVDEEYDVFEYRLRPGMAVQEFEEKKKYFESAFNSKAIVNGKGSWLEIKIRKTPYQGLS